MPQIPNFFYHQSCRKLNLNFIPNNLGEKKYANEVLFRLGNLRLDGKDALVDTEFKDFEIALTHQCKHVLG